ncbi:MAG: DUF2318 domain-containing protein [Firmicutes bacterium]|nr:DUF2318 domain-containing protein [Bacillota bacterium]
MDKQGIKKIVFNVAVVASLAVLVYYASNPKTEAGPQPNTITQEREKPSGTAPEAVQQPQATEKAKEPTKEPTRETTKEAAQEAPKDKSGGTAIEINKSEITSTAKFYPYALDGVTMEIIAVKASDGSIRTALNTCQVCFDSGRGYYKQVGDYFVCQNCGNRFHIDQVEKIKGGCNPVPILEGDKQYAGDYITISKGYMAAQKEYFTNWRKT